MHIKIKNKLKYFVVIIIISVIFLTWGCAKRKSTEPVSDTYESVTMLNQLEGNSGDCINTYAPVFISASDLRTKYLADTNKTQLFIIDVRADTDYVKGHIQGSVNVQLHDLLSYFNTNNLKPFKDVAIVDFTGEKAAFAASLMQLAGFGNVCSLYWGLSAWNIDFDKWDMSVGNSKSNLLSKEPVPKLFPGNMPKLITGKSSGSDIINSRIQAVLDEDFGKTIITNDNVFQNLSQYYIIQYSHYDEYIDCGHIPGSINYVPHNDLRLSTYLKTLPINKPIVIYDVTGQISGYIAAFLRMLGYDARILIYGENGMMYNILESNGLSVWKITECKNYPYVK